MEFFNWVVVAAFAGWAILIILVFRKFANLTARVILLEQIQSLLYGGMVLPLIHKRTGVSEAMIGMAPGDDELWRRQFEPISPEWIARKKGNVSD